MHFDIESLKLAEQQHTVLQEGNTLVGGAHDAPLVLDNDWLDCF